MHAQREPETDAQEPEPPAVPRAPSAPPAPRWRAVGGTAVAAGLLLTKLKGLLALLAGFKWLVLVPKLLASSGSLVISIWFYALFFGWKFGIVFVLLILVHELGHWITFRNFGIPVGLPFFIPGLGAFVKLRGPVPNLGTEALAVLAGPVFGLGGAAVCLGYGLATAEPFWYAAAYTGFFLNAFNLLPLPPLDGGRLAGAIEPRLWIVGAAGFAAWIVVFSAWSPFTIILALFIAATAIPRLRDLRAGRIDPRLAALAPPARAALAAAYFVTAALAAAGMAATHVAPEHLGTPG